MISKANCSESWTRGLVASSLAAILICGQAHSQTYPSKPIRFVVPFPPGGAADFLARPMAQKMAESMGQPVVLENRPGADGAIGAEATARAAADGHTIMLGTMGTHVLNALFQKTLPYDPIRDFTPITLSTLSVIGLVANPSNKFSSLNDLIERARKQPGAFGFASNGNGSPHHIAGELLKKLAGINLLHVPYKGGAQAATDLLSGVVPLGFFTLAAVLPHIQQGKLQLLGVIEPKRFALLPSSPSIGEVVPGYEMSSWSGVLGPAKLPPEILARLHRELVAAIKAPDTVKRYEPAGLSVVASTPEQFASTIVSDTAKWKKITAELGLAPE
ncbi:MAG: Bug family tripartite tricarboxylate transporter substrate binding protein [Burkholderiales bacterium]